MIAMKLPPTLRLLFFFLALQASLSGFCQEVEKVADSLIAEFPKMDEADRGKAFIKTNSQFIQKDVEASLSFIAQIEEYAQKANDTILLINVKALTAEYFWRKSEYQQGIEYALASIELSSSNSRFQSEMARGFQTAGTIHLYLSNTDQVLNYYELASGIYKATGQLTSLASIFNNTGVAYMDAAEVQDNLAFGDSALVYYNKVFELKDHARPWTLLNALGNLGTIYAQKEDWINAEKYNAEWEALESQNPSPRSRSMNYGIIGLTHLRRGRLVDAEYYLSKGLKYSEELGAKYEMQEYYFSLSELREKKRDFENALMNSKKGWALKDSIYNAEKVNAINELEAKYQNEKNSREIERANAEIEKKERFQKFLLLVIGAIIVFGGLALLLIIQRFKLRKKLQSQEIDTLRAQILTILRKVPEEQEIDFSNLNQGLHNPLSERELEILQHALTDNSNREIADQLFVSINTVKTHLKNVYSKIGVSNRKEALEVLLSKK